MERMPRLNSAQVMLQMYYPGRKGEDMPLMAPYLRSAYRAQIEMDEAETERLKVILSRLKPAPMRWLLPFTAAPREPGDDIFCLSIKLSFSDGDVWLPGVNHSIIRESELRKASGAKFGDLVDFVLSDADYDALKALPSIRKAYDWSVRYHDAPADFFTSEKI